MTLLWRRLLRNPTGTASLTFLVAVVLSAVLAPLLAPHDPNTASAYDTLSGPSGKHWLGNDSSGHDVLSRLLFATRLSVAQIPGTERHVVLVNGIEPNLRWRSFCRELLDHAERLGVTKVITLGALLTDTPHTRPTPVSGTSYDKASAASMDVEPSTYQGPTGIVGVFQNACVEAGIPAFSFWASVPHYVSQARVPKAAVALLHRVEEVLDVEVPLGALPEQAEEWERTVSEMAEADDEVREYVRQLEEQAEESEGAPEADGDTIAADFERYLRRRGAGGPGS